MTSAQATHIRLFLSTLEFLVPPLHSAPLCLSSQLSTTYLLIIVATTCTLQCSSGHSSGFQVCACLLPCGGWHVSGVFSVSLLPGSKSVSLVTSFLFISFHSLFFCVWLFLAIFKLIYSFLHPDCCPSLPVPLTEPHPSALSLPILSKPFVPCFMWS